MATTPLQSNTKPGGPHIIQDMRLTTGTIFYVSSVVGNSTYDGLSPDTPVATIDQAINKCTDSKGDIILVMPGHAEAVSGAAGISLDVIGVSVIGLGYGAMRPTITLSAVAATVAMGAASCRLENLLFTVSDDATIGIDVNAANCQIVNCELRNSASKEAVTWIDVTGSGANACDYTLIKDCIILCPAVGTTQGIELGEVANRVQIIGCEIDGDFGNACIHNPTGKVLTKLRIEHCTLTNTQSGDHAIELVSACTGTISWNIVNSTLAAAGGLTAVDQGACFCNQNYGVDATADVSGLLNPVADS